MGITYDYFTKAGTRFRRKYNETTSANVHPGCDGGCTQHRFLGLERWNPTNKKYEDSKSPNFAGTKI